jgi:hypothetical protein
VQSLLNSFKNEGVIPGYEPRSIGFHGDDGKVYYNSSRNISVDELIRQAQTDPEKLVGDAERDASLFEIQNQTVFST